MNQLTTLLQTAYMTCKFQDEVWQLYNVKSEIDIINMPEIRQQSLADTLIRENYKEEFNNGNMAGDEALSAISKFLES